MKISLINEYVRSPTDIKAAHMPVASTLPLYDAVTVDSIELSSSDPVRLAWR